MTDATNVSSAAGRDDDSAGDEAPATATATAVDERSDGAARAGDESLVATPAPRTGSWFDDTWRRMTATPRLLRRTEWIMLGAVTLLAALLRLVGLSHPGSLVFDETFYVKDAWTLVNLGYEGTWPENANDSWAAGDPNTYSSDASYVVHPPFGKLVIGLGLLLFGAENPFAWRASVAIIGVAAVVLLWFVARKLLGSPVLATIGAGMLAIDGHAIVMSRVAILDGILMFFVLLGAYFVLLDRDDQRGQLQGRILAWRRTDGPPEGRGPDGLPLAPVPTPFWSTARAPTWPTLGPDWGPVLWARPWLLAAAVTFALASSVKWSGLYFLAAFCLYTIAVDALERRRQGVTFWLSAAVLKQGPASFVITIPAALAVYIASWSGWLATTGGFYRTWAEEAGHAWTGLLSWVPLPLQSLWHYSVEAYRFHTGLGADHPYQSSPLEWPFLIRPTAFSYTYSDPSPSCSGVETCVEAITSISNPLIWWSGTVAILFIAIMSFLQPRWQYGFVLVGFAAGYLPWMAYLQRQAVFHFYAIVYLPFMILAVLFVFQTIAGTPDSPRRLRTAGVAAIGGVVVLFALVSALFLPVWTGMLIPDWYWSLTHWLPGWK
ncbi:dolichyl-phosphate-mannose--protein mannosyltransferase [Pseudoclavibacter endophyticus]|uniref:dolichyl-phosphate-mannose--protein mannosyltransferase n=1 Tax=Pseudoclavibacter endophyticus TaxID=1778590 RepID=UPI001662E48F|nr:phospholipid carrier-dependent glycosyltransferase [Pseudoclavibacter endophyticus]